MIYSAVNDNWLRVKVMHSIANDFYASTSGTDFRRRITSRDEVFPFDPAAYETIENESRIVGMVMAWSVVTIESLVNHQLAVSLNDKAIARTAIEYPAKALRELQISKSPRSELAKKLLILSIQGQIKSDDYSTVFELAAFLADKRNLIVHDKPFRLIDNGHGDVDIHWFRERGEAISPRARYEDLVAFYNDCDTVTRFVLTVNPESLDCNIDFRSLISD